MVEKIRRVKYRNKKSFRRVYFGLAFSLSLFVVSPGWVHIYGWYF